MLSSPRRRPSRRPTVSAANRPAAQLAAQAETERMRREAASAQAAAQAETDRLKQQAAQERANLEAARLAAQSEADRARQAAPTPMRCARNPSRKGCCCASSALAAQRDLETRRTARG